MIQNNTLKLYRKGFVAKSPFSILGLIFIIIVLVVIMPLFWVLGKLLKDPYENYDYKRIIASGKITDARIKCISTKKNVTINGIHPRVISYEYIENDSMLSDKFQTLSVAQTDSLQNKDSLKITVLNHQSVVNGIEPYSFSLKMLWGLPLIFLIIGLPFFLMGHFSGMRYVKDGAY